MRKEANYSRKLLEERRDRKKKIHEEGKDMRKKLRAHEEGRQ